jgi:UDP-glucose 4-epimerase
MVRVLVTGCAGFIGSNLCRALLEAGYAVSGIDDLSAGLQSQVPAGVDLAVRDIRDPAIAPLFGGVEVVFHLAARNCPSDCMIHPAATADVNVTGTVQVLEACRRAGVRKVVYADSSAVYEGLDELPSVEARTGPVGPYAVSKEAGARFVAGYGRLYGLRYTILRYFNVYGPAQDHRRVVAPVMSAFALALLSGVPARIFGDGSKRRDFVYVDDVNDFHLACIRDSRSDGKVLNLGSGENHSMLDIYEVVAELLGTRRRPRFEPELPGEAAATLANIDAARALGFTPRIGLKEGVRRAIDYLRTHAVRVET